MEKKIEEMDKRHNIKGKARVYIKTGAREYKSLLLAIRNIKWADIKNKEEEFIKKNKFQILPTT